MRNDFLSMMVILSIVMFLGGFIWVLATFFDTNYWQSWALMITGFLGLCIVSTSPHLPAE